ncbi:hypothetical protein DFH27DRAFT_526157 [Peziza echinospora]|nr:hypothetical protein DFH27DRAFT_526157 [Peziza echinospora]
MCVVYQYVCMDCDADVDEEVITFCTFALREGLESTCGDTVVLRTNDDLCNECKEFLLMQKLVREGLERDEEITGENLESEEDHDDTGTDLDEESEEEEEEEERNHDQVEGGDVPEDHPRKRQKTS